MRSNQQNDIKCEFLVSHNPRNHLLSSTISQIMKIIFKMANGGHFEFGIQISRLQNYETHIRNEYLAPNNPRTQI